MSIFQPKISIIIPVYNGSDYLKLAIDSALAQTYDNIEVIVVNDGSNDDGKTDRVAQTYGDKIRYYKKKNGGVSTALNLAIDKMTGDYFSWLSHDDVYLNNKIERQVDFLDSLSNKDSIIYADFELIDEAGDLIERCKLDHGLLEHIPIYSLLRGMINGITMLIPAKAFKTHGKFDDSLKCVQDYDMWSRLFNDYPFVHQQDILTQTRIHPGQGTTSNPLAITEANKLWVRIIEELSDSEKRKAEGDLFAFYLEMVRFLKNTPYDHATEHCIQKLEHYARSKEVNTESYGTAYNATRIFNKLIDEGQQISAAYFITNVVGQLMMNNKHAVSADIIKQTLVGDLEDIDSGVEVEKYISNVLSKKKKKRLLFCSGYWLTGGVERVLSILFEQLKDEYELFLVTPYDGRKSSIPMPPYVHHIVMSTEQYSTYDVVSLSYATMLKVDVVIGLNWEEVQLSLYEMCKAVGIKTIASNHEIYFYPYFNINLHAVINRRVESFKDVDAVLWPTNFSAAAYGLRADNSYLMPNPNTYEIKPFRQKQDSETILLCVGRFTDYVKRIDRVLQCFSIVSKNIPNAKLVLVGKYNNDVEFMPGDNRTVNDLIREYRIDETRVEFVGEVEDVDKYYSKASLLLVASNNEGFCMAINEAASFKVPTVCMRIPGLEDLVQDGVNGYIVEQDDIDEFSRKVEAVLTDGVLRKKMREHAQSYVKKFDRVEVGDSWKYLISIITSGDMSEVNRRAKLRKRLDYKVDDYRVYSRLLLDEMDKIVVTMQDGPVNEETVRAYRENENLRKENYELSSDLNQIRNSKRWKMTSQALDVTVGNVRRLTKRQRSK